MDVVGGTSQGAFMAGLFAQGLAKEQLQAMVRQRPLQGLEPIHSTTKAG